MQSPSLEVLELMKKAAAMRAEGAAWAVVGRELQRHPDTCRHWVTAYPQLWHRLYRQAERLLTKEAGAEAVVVLRNLVRSENEKTRLAAAEQLLKMQPKRRPRSAGSADSEDAAERLAFLTEARGLNDADLAKMLRRLLEDSGLVPRVVAALPAPPSE